MKCERLDVWKRSCRLSVDVYKCFASSRDFGFKDQITRSSLSIASNIANCFSVDLSEISLAMLEFGNLRTIKGCKLKPYVVI